MQTPGKKSNSLLWFYSKIIYSFKSSTNTYFTYIRGIMCSMLWNKLPRLSRFIFKINNEWYNDTWINSVSLQKIGCEKNTRYKILDQFNNIQSIQTNLHIIYSSAEPLNNLNMVVILIIYIYQNSWTSFISVNHLVAPPPLKTQFFIQCLLKLYLNLLELTDKWSIP